MWQTVITAILVVSAALYLGLRLRRWLRQGSGSGCAFCPKCQDSTDSSRKPKDRCPGSTA